MLGDLLGALVNMDQLDELRHNVLLGFILTVSTKSNAAQYTAVLYWLSDWNVSRKLHSRGSMVQLLGSLEQTKEDKQVSLSN